MVVISVDGDGDVTGLVVGRSVVTRGVSKGIVVLSTRDCPSSRVVCAGTPSGAGRIWTGESSG